MMSNVRVSSGSPSLERMEARQPPPQPPPPQPSQSEPPKPSACRSLFGPVDHRELARELRRHRREQEEASRARWNFDFQRHRPLQGRFQWQALRRQALPDFYSRGAALLGTRDGDGDGDGGSSPEGRRRERGGGTPTEGSPPRREAREQRQEEEEEEAKAAAAALGAAGKEDLAGHKSPAAAQRKRPPGDDSFPPNKRANMTEEAISEGSPSASSVEQTPKKSSPRQRPT